MKARGYKLSQINDLVEDNVRDEWHCGRFLREIERVPGERTDTTSFQPEMRFTPYKLALKEAGLSEVTAHRWQIMSFVPESVLTAYCARQRQKAAVITSADVYRMGRQYLKEEKRQEYIEQDEEEWEEAEESSAGPCQIIHGDFADMMLTLP